MVCPSAVDMFKTLTAEGQNKNFNIISLLTLF